MESIGTVYSYTPNPRVMKVRMNISFGSAMLPGLMMASDPSCCRIERSDCGYCD